MKSENSPYWHYSDVSLALERALSDPGITPDRQQALMHEVIVACISSPYAFEQLWKSKGNQILRPPFLTKAYEACKRHPKGEAFRVWLDQFTPHATPPEPVLLSRSQKAAWESLEETADLYFSGDLRNARIQPRTARLIAGPSGVGKSHLVRTFAKANHLGFLRLTYGGWLPIGARGADHTCDTVTQFLMAHKRCVIAFDELDKIHGELRSDWGVTIKNELYALLDRTWFQGDGDQAGEVSRRLRENTLLVGCGTWQNLWNVNGGAQRAAGFHQAPSAPMGEQIRLAGAIPTELLNRFNADLILLEPMRGDDFAAVCRAEGLETQAKELGVSVDYVAAEESGQGMRWLEALTLQLSTLRRKRARTGVPSPAPDTPRPAESKQAAA